LQYNEVVIGKEQLASSCVTFEMRSGGWIQCFAMAEVVEKILFTILQKSHV